MMEQNTSLDVNVVIYYNEDVKKKKYPPYSSENPEWRQKVYDNGLVLPGMTGYWTVKEKLYNIN